MTFGIQHDPMSRPIALTITVCKEGSSREKSLVRSSQWTDITARAKTKQRRSGPIYRRLCFLAVRGSAYCKANSCETVGVRERCRVVKSCWHAADGHAMHFKAEDPILIEGAASGQGSWRHIFGPNFRIQPQQLWISLVEKESQRFRFLAGAEGCCKV